MFNAWKGSDRPASDLQEELRRAKDERLMAAPHLADSIKADFTHSLLLVSAAENDRFHQEGIARAEENAAEARRVHAAATATAANTPVPEGPLPDNGNFAFNYPISQMREKIKNEGGRGRNHAVNVNQTATVGIMINYYRWYDLFKTPTGNVVHLSANCKSLSEARVTHRRLSSVELGTHHNIRICDHCLKRGR